jgi:hypothetical protein
MKTIISLLLLTVLFQLPAHADNQFTTEFAQKWATHDAEQIKTYVETKVAASPTNPQYLVARAIVAASLQSWGRGAASFLVSAKASVASDSTLTEAQKSTITNEIETFRALVVASSDDSGEAANSSPKWEAGTHTLMFEEFSQAPPMFNVLQAFP